MSRSHQDKANWDAPSPGEIEHWRKVVAGIDCQRTMKQARSGGLTEARLRCQAIMSGRTFLNALHERRHFGKPNPRRIDQEMFFGRKK